jgi:competence protein ComEC
MYVQTGNTTWLLLANADLKAQRLLLDRTLQKSTTQAQILWWTGGNLLPELLQVVKPTTAIASSLSISESTLAQLRNSNIRLYWTSRDGAIQWNKDNEVRAFSDREDASSPF